MLRSYAAELNGSQLVWLGEAPPVRNQPQRIVVVVEEQTGALPTHAPIPAFEQARGCLGQHKREDVLAELGRMRDEW